MFLLGDVVAEVERVARERLPPSAELTWRGEAGEFKDNSAMIYFSFALALVVVFLVLAAQFESFLHPLVDYDDGASGCDGGPRRTFDFRPKRQSLLSDWHHRARGSGPPKTAF